MVHVVTDLHQLPARQAAGGRLPAAGSVMYDTVRERSE
jgi:hypothetical protein